MKDLRFWRTPACQTLSNILNISSATAQVAPDLLNALAITSDTTVRRFVVDQEDLKPYQKSDKRPNFYRWSKTLLTTERRLTGQQFLAVGTLHHSEIQEPPMRPSNNMENKTLSDTYWRVHLVCMKVQAHGALEPWLSYNQNATHFMNQDLLWPF